MINHFPAARTYNPGGYSSFLFLPHQLVASFPMISNGAVLVPVGLSGSAAWYQGYATRETLSYDEEPQDSGHGTYYNIAVAGFVPGESAALIDLMETLAVYKHILVVIDVFGRKRLVGSPSAPLSFSAKFNSGTGRPDAKGFNFKFYGEALYRAPVYNV